MEGDSGGAARERRRKMEGQGVEETTIAVGEKNVENKNEKTTVNGSEDTK